ncbi:MAG: hypothetical protein ACRC4O_02300 [Giesbergeria sp.]
MSNWRTEHGAPSAETSRCFDYVQRARNEIERASLADRKIYREEYRAAIADRPQLVAERVAWLLDGHYGFEHYVVAWSILATGSGNKVARLAQLIAAFEWSCPDAFARQAWRSLEQQEQERVNAAIQAEIDRAIQAREEGES